MDPMPGIGKYTTLLGRNFKCTECEADSAFLAKVVALQENPHVLTAKRTAEDVEIEDATPSSSTLNEDQSRMTDVIESDGLCLSTGESNVKRNKVQSTDGESEDVDVALLQAPPPTVLASSGKNPDAPVSPEQTANNEEVENLDTAAPLEEEDLVDGNQTYTFQEALKLPLEENTPAESVQVGLDNVEEIPPDEDVTPSASMPVSVSNKIDLDEYSQSEWKGATYGAQQMRLGYSQIMQSTGCRAMRRIRGDNYCGIRATSFQVLSQNLKILQSWKKLDDILSIPERLMRDHQSSWLQQWSFAGRLRVSPKKKIETMRHCLEIFCEQIEASQSMTSEEARTLRFLAFFNSGREEEILVFEALKLLMLHAAVVLHADMTAEKDVPVFAWLLFARDTSENPEQLMKNHLNTVGDSGGLEQVEMFLLGYALNVTIRVVRPSKVHQEDFMTHYPDDHIDEWDMCNLIAEDDRHYNVIVT